MREIKRRNELRINRVSKDKKFLKKITNFTVSNLNSLVNEQLSYISNPLIERNSYLYKSGIKQVSKVMICYKNTVLLLLRHKDIGNGNTWGFPGGNRDAGESEYSCLLRECKEEIGVDITKFSIEKTLYVSNNKKSKFYTIYLVDLTDEEYNNMEIMLNEEHIEHRWFQTSEMFSVNLHPLVSKVFAENFIHVKQYV